MYMRRGGRRPYIRLVGKRTVQTGGHLSADESKVDILCKQCHKRLEVSTDETPESRHPCPDCGATGREILVELRGTVKVRAGVGTKVTPASKLGRKKYSREEYDFPSVRKADGKPVRRHTLIDRKNDWYEERVTTEDGEVMHCCKERLSEHHGHGSAKGKFAGPQEGSGPKDR